MAITVNTNIRIDTISGYLLDAMNIRGISFTVASMDDLNKLPVGTLIAGSRVYVTETNKTYRYYDGAWITDEQCYSAGDGITIEYDEATKQYVISRASVIAAFLDFPFDYLYDYTYTGV